MAFYSGKIVKETTRKRSKFLYTLVGLLVFLLLGGYAVLSYTGALDKIKYYRCYWDSSTSASTFGAQSTTQTVTIEPGMEPLAIGSALQNAGIIKNSTDFLCYVRKIDAGNLLQAGYYEIPLPVSLEQLVPLLKNAQVQTVRVTLQEGLRMDEIADKLEQALSINNARKQFDRDEFLALTTDKSVIDAFAYTKGQKSLEGFLFPDTYVIAKNGTSKEILDLLLSTFSTKIAESAPIATAKTLSPYEVVVLASIIEKEAGKSFEEKQTIAGILLKRMDNGWLLQVDATFLYEKKDWKAPITYLDKKNDTPYNTYLHKGLPPTPINNPGLDAIKAVLTPKESPYWFYLHGTDGKVRYAKTNAEHQQNITLYLR